jgi:hypothetical protein
MGAYIDYVDVIPGLLGVIERARLGYDYRGYRFDQYVQYPCVMVRPVGGTDSTRIQLIARADNPNEAMKACIDASNALTQDSQYINEFVPFGITMDSNPMLTYTTEAEKPEAWCYLTLDHLES